MSSKKPETGENHHKGMPDFNVEQARVYLDYGTKESVYLKAREGKENGGFDAYIFVANEDGVYGWRKKIGVGHTSMNIMFYKSDLDEWARLHPARDRARVEYGEKDRDEVLALAKSLMENGTVTRQAVYTALVTEAGWKKKHTNYAKMAQILDDYNIPGKNLAKASRANTNQGRHKKTALAS